MYDLISRQAAIMHFVRVSKDYECRMFELKEVTHELWQMPAAEKRGKWMKEWRSANGYTRINGYKCSGCTVAHPWPTNYCPNCGARMTEESE